MSASSTPKLSPRALAEAQRILDHEARRVLVERLKRGEARPRRPAEQCSRATFARTGARST